MKRVVVYNTKYGSSKEYALLLSNRLEIPLLNINEIKDYDFIDAIYVAPVYKSRMIGLNKLLKYQNIKHLVLIPVSFFLYDNILKQNIFEKKVNLKVSNKIYLEIYFLKGVINLEKLSLIDKLKVKHLIKKYQVDNFDIKIDEVSLNKLCKLLK